MRIDLSPFASAAHVVGTADNFLFLNQSRRRWLGGQTLRALERRSPGFTAFARVEAARREIGLQRLGKLLCLAGAGLGVAQAHLEYFAAYLHDFDDQYYYLPKDKGGYRRVDDVVDEIRQLAATLATAAGEGDEDIDDVRFYWGLTDLIIGQFTEFVDDVPNLATYLINKGAFRTPEYKEKLKTVEKMIERAPAHGLDPSPLRQFVLDREVAQLTPALEFVVAYRGFRLQELGYTPGAELATFPDPCASLTLRLGPDPNAPYWPAKKFFERYQIPPERLRQAKHRGQLAYIILPNTKWPRYSWPGVKRLWHEQIPDRTPPSM